MSSYRFLIIFYVTLLGGHMFWIMVRLCFHYRLLLFEVTRRCTRSVYVTCVCMSRVHVCVSILCVCYHDYVSLNLSNNNNYSIFYKLWIIHILNLIFTWMRVNIFVISWTHRKVWSIDSMKLLWLWTLKYISLNRHTHQNIVWTFYQGSNANCVTALVKSSN